MTARQGMHGRRGARKQDGGVSSRWAKKRRQMAVALAVFLALQTMGASASAQYIPDTGDVARPDIPSRETLDDAYVDSPWRLGGLGVQPWLGLDDASYVTNQSPDPSEGETSDFTATLGAGVRAYARSSPKLMLAAHVLPEYIWWQDDSSRSQVAGRYGAGLFAHLNRVQVEVSYRFSEQQRFFSDEVQILASSETTVAKLAAVFELRRGIEIYAVARDSEVVTESDDFEFLSLLDRSEQRLGFGLRLMSQRGFDATVGVEDSSTDFGGSARDLSNDGTTVALGLGFQRDRSGVRLGAAFRDIEPVEGSRFLPFDDVTGNLEFTWKPRSGVELVSYLDRSQAYSIDLDQSYFVSDRVGIMASFAIGRSRLSLRLASGEDDYEGVLQDNLGDSANQEIGRLDDVTEVLAILQVPVGDLLVLGLQGRYVDYDSNREFFDRDITSYGLSLGLGKVIERLRIGSGERTW